MAEIRKYILKHKNISVAALTLDCVTGGILSVDQVCSEAHVPVGVSVKKGRIDRSALNAWWSGRAIPASRSGLKEALLRMDIPHVSYRLLVEEGYPYSVCDDFVTPDTERL